LDTATPQKVMPRPDARLAQLLPSSTLPLLLPPRAARNLTSRL
jgi:hypothetical protein